jgi:small subunit ribosomal protein S17
MAEEIKKAAEKGADAAKPAAKKPAVKKTSLTRAKKPKEERNTRKVLTGIVVSNKMDKTGIAEVERKVPHPIYKKVVIKTSRFKFHDEKNECDIGDTVEIIETRPLSRDKYFRLNRIVKKVK